MHELSNFIKDYGGYAGAASVLGLAILSLLYFAQAREVKRLREWAGRAPERDAELQARVAADAARRSGPAAAPVAPRQVARQPGVPQTAAAQAAAGRPATANGAAGGVPAGAVAGGLAAGAAVAAAKAAEAAQQTQAAPAPVGAAAGAGAPPTVATTAPPTTPSSTAPAAGATPSPFGGDDPTTDGDASALPPVPPRTAAGRPAGAAALRSDSTRSRPATVQTQRAPRRLAVLPVALGVAGVIIVVVALVLILGGGNGSSPSKATHTTGGVVPSPNASTTTNGGQSSSAPRPKSQTTVAVLNGTTVSGLAKSTADKIQAAGYAKGKVADAVNQNQSATLVQYADGARNEALAVAKLIGLGADAVSKLDVNTRAVAGDNAQVVVTVGSDQSAQSGQG